MPGFGNGLGLNKRRPVGASGSVLDQFPGAAAAWGFVTLSDSYSGDVVTLERLNDNATEGFTVAELVAGNDATWVGANNAVVATLHDQTGNGVNLTQGTSGNRPLFIDAGTPVTRLGHRAMKAADTTDKISGGAGLTAGAGLTVFIIFGNDGTSGGNDGIFGKWAGSANEYLLAARDSVSPDDVVLISSDGSSTTKTSTGAVLNTAQTNLFTVVIGADSHAVYKNGAEIGSDEIEGVVDSDGLFTLFSYNSGSNLADPNSFIIAAIVYKSDKSADRAAIESAINSQFSIY